MERLTRRTASGWEVEDLSAVLEELARFENFRESVTAGQGRSQEARELTGKSSPTPRSCCGWSRSA